MRTARPLSFAVLLVAYCYPVLASSDSWEPPESPDPSVILDEAQSDTEAGRYATALAKHVWYHENALKYDPYVSGVRLSFALGDWRRLANRYPPALQKMEKIRDRSEEWVRENKDDHQAFMDVVALNRQLKELDKTVGLFKWLDSNDPSFASAAYLAAQGSLVEAGEFDLCGKYLDATKEYESHLQLLRWRLEAAEATSDPMPATERAQELFAYQMALVVTILTKTDKTKIATAIANYAVLDLKQDSHIELIRSAQAGVIPEVVF